MYTQIGFENVFGGWRRTECGHGGEAGWQVQLGLLGLIGETKCLQIDPRIGENFLAVIKKLECDLLGVI